MLGPGTSSLFCVLGGHFSHSLVRPIAEHPDPPDDVEQTVDGHDPSQEEEVQIVLSDVCLFVGEDEVEGNEGSISDEEDHPFHTFVPVLSKDKVEEGVDSQDNEDTVEVFHLLVVGIEGTEDASANQPAVAEPFHPLPFGWGILLLDTFVANQLEEGEEEKAGKDYPRGHDLPHVQFCLLLFFYHPVS